MKLSLLSIAAAARTAVAATTGNAEVDVIFPRNDTFALTPLLPVVFAVQNPAVAQQLNLRLHYRVIPYGHSNTTTPYERVRLDALPSNDTTFYVHDFVAGAFDRQGIWEFFWQLRWNNCTATKDDDIARDTEEPVRSFVFTTHNDGSKPDLVALSSGEQCGNTQAIAFEVQDVLNVPPPQNADSLTSCAHVAAPAPTPTPCSAAVFRIGGKYLFAHDRSGVSFCIARDQLPDGKRKRTHVNQCGCRGFVSLLGALRPLSVEGTFLLRSTQ